MVEVLGTMSVGLASVVKPVLCASLLLVWARWATIVDKDTLYYNLNRRIWNTVQVGAAAAGMAIVVFMPFFLVGFPLGLVIIGGAMGAYVLAHNREAPDGKKWRFDKDMLIDMLEERRMEKEMRKAVLRFTEPPEGLLPVPLPEDEMRESHLMFEQVIENALRRGAQRLDLAGNDKQFISGLLIDGVEYSQGELPAISTMTMIDYLKSQAKLDVANRRRRQVGICKIDHEELGEHELCVHTFGSSRGLSCQIQIDLGKQLAIPYAKLGLLDGQSDLLTPILDRQAGVVLVGCPNAHGRSTTLYSLIEHHDPYTMDIHTIETREQRHLEGVKQNSIPDDNEIAKRLHTMLLRDPQVVMIDRVPNGDIARALAEGAEDGPRVYAGLTAGDTFEALRTWLGLVVDSQAALNSLRAIVSQRLLRKLCTTCRQEYQPDPAVIKKINQKIEKLYKSGGQVLIRGKAESCPDCGGLGYKGSVAAFEVMPIDDTARAKIAAGQMDELRTHLRRQKVLYLQEAALAKVIAGITSLSELTRAFSTKSKDQG